MIEDQSKQSPPESGVNASHHSLPTGYRQGVITAITVVLGFSLLFVRYWGFELPGSWTVGSVIAAILLSLAIVLEFVALWRSLLVTDDDLEEYTKTLRWFFVSVIMLLISLAIAGFAHWHDAKP